MNSVKVFFLSMIFSAMLAKANAFTDFDETKIQAPFKDSNEQNLTSIICKTRKHERWDICFNRLDDESEQMKSFTFTNFGENKIVPKSGFGIGRSFEFMFEDFARSDLGLLVWDIPDEVMSHGHLKLMVFLPRLVLPSIRYVSDADIDQVIVTLPNKEEVVFNAKSREVIGGVLSEGAIKQDDEGNALNPDLFYTGKGVVIEADRLNDYPVGYNAQNGKNNYATIRKIGFKNCKIPVKDLWYTDDNKGGNIFFNKQYVTDDSLDQLIKSKCHFSMFN